MVKTKVSNDYSKISQQILKSKNINPKEWEKELLEKKRFEIASGKNKEWDKAVINEARKELVLSTLGDNLDDFLELVLDSNTTTTSKPSSTDSN